MKCPGSWINSTGAILAEARASDNAHSRSPPLNALALYGVASVLAAAFAAQLLRHELPCPRCLLRRIMLALRSLRNIQPALDRGPLQTAVEPTHDMLELIEVDQPARFVEADQVAHPAERGNVGDAVVIVHEPLPAGEMRFHHAEQTL